MDGKLANADTIKTKLSADEPVLGSDERQILASVFPRTELARILNQKFL